MNFDREYFQKICGIITGTKFAPILANIYTAMLENELCKKCVLDPNIKMHILFKRFIVDGFGIIEGNMAQK